MLTKKIRSTTNHRSQGFLCWKKQGYTEQREISDFLSIGRADTNQLILEDPFASRHHARIEYKKDKGFFILKDMNSKNGLLLNGNRIYQAVLSDKDVIKVGETVFLFSFERYNNKWQLTTQSTNEIWNDQLARIPYLSQNNYPVLLQGASGTGKEIMARLIHKHSPRNQSPMVTINCGALTESLVESELFGHTKGSYTGAVSHRQGAFLSANGGTLFLDEVGELPLTLQPKLLRAIEYQEIKPVGSDKTFKTDVRIVAATHQDLTEKIQKKQFREDLYYRLNVISIKIPNLRDRMEDFDNFLEMFSVKYGVSFSKTAIEYFKKYPWPGNIRELKNTVARAKALFTTQVIDRERAKLLLDNGEDIMKKDQSTQEPLTLKEIERNVIINLLKKYDGHQSKVAKELDIPRSSLSDRLGKLRINPKMFKPAKTKSTRPVQWK